MIVVSLLTEPGPEEKSLPTLKEINSSNHDRSVYVFAIVLVIVMIGLYAVFG